MLARTACATSVSDRASCDAERSGSTAGRIRSTIARNPGDWSGVGRRSSSMVVTIAPHAVCPSTTTSRVPNRSAANSTLPTCDGATMFPATRITNRSPNPCPNTNSAGTRASEHPRMMAKGSCVCESVRRRAALWSCIPCTTRRFPSRSRASASAADSIHHRHRLWFLRQRRRLRDAWALTAGPRPHLEDLLNFKQPLPTVDASRVSVHPAKTHEHGLVRQRGGPVIPALECRILHRDDRLRIITREERSRAVLVHIQAMDFRGPMTGNQGCRENQDSLRTHGALPFALSRISGPALPAAAG